MPERGSGEARQLARNALWLGGGEVTARAVGFAISLYLARALDATGYGAVGIAAALVHVFDLLVRAGMAPPATREIARDAESLPEVFARVVGLRLVLAVAVVAAVWLALPQLSSAFDVPPLLLALYALSLFPVAASGNWALRGLEAMSQVAASRILERLLVLAGVLLLVREGGRDLLRVPVVEVGAAAAIAAGYYVYLCRRQGRMLRIRFRASRWPGLLSEGVPVTLSLMSRSMYLQGDVLLLGWLATAESAGQFLVSQKLVLALAGVAVVLRDASFPATSRMVREDPAAALRLQAGMLRYALIALAPAVAVGLVFATPLVAALFGGEYDVAPRVLRIMLFTLPVVALAGNLRNLLIAAAQPHPLPRADALAAGVHVVLGVALIPLWGAVGAAAACLAGECVAAALLARIVRDRLGSVPWERRALAPMAAAGLMAGVLATDWAGLPLRICAGGLVYAVAAIGLGALRRDELHQLASQLRDLTGSRRSG
ncbi:MAG: oligosaccharide flippase family protein [Proteobacteria bacterium]|nr:oligosaccharide flippase family protein [Pseudomonadota bacterium]